MTWKRSSTVDHLPADPVGDVAAESIAEVLQGGVVELVYSPADREPPPTPVGPATASASGDGPAGWRVAYTVRLGEPMAALVPSDSTRLMEIVNALPGAALRASARFRASDAGDAAPEPLTPSMRRALRDRSSSRCSPISTRCEAEMP